MIFFNQEGSLKGALKNAGITYPCPSLCMKLKLFNYSRPWVMPAGLEGSPKSCQPGLGIVCKEDFRQRNEGPLNYLCYNALLEIIIHNLSTHQYDTQSQQVKILEYVVRKEKKISLWLMRYLIWGYIRTLLDTAKMENINILLFTYPKHKYQAPLVLTFVL